MKAKHATPEVIAHVGGSKPPTSSDLYRLILAMEAAGKLWPRKVLHSEIINILYGRDFLQEDRTYDIVILHSIFHTHTHYMESIRTNETSIIKPQISPRHTEEAWRQRLVATQARLIIVLEIIPFSLSGWQLGELPGYSIHTRDGHLTIYQRTI